MNWYLLVLKKYADFNGRARRKEYWYFTLVSILISIVLTIIEMKMKVAHIDSLYSLAVLLPSIAVGVRRMHDVGKSGWFILIPIYNLILACTEGNKGTNEYGPDPKRPELEDDIELIGRN
jgi:uncharacterized membrane protein YhaH (DUF805 family)